jgi:mannose-6-phosphate isomerase-like protein (cupin superfamily)
MQSKTSKSATIFPSNQIHDLQFLGNQISYKFNPDDRSECFFELTVIGNCPLPLHRHPWDEVFYLLEGEIDLQIDDQKMQATPGYFVNLPAGAAHTFAVRPAQAKFLVWVSDRRAMQFSKELAQAEQA